MDPPAATTPGTPLSCYNECATPCTSARKCRSSGARSSSNAAGSWRLTRSGAPDRDAREPGGGRASCSTTVVDARRGLPRRLAWSAPQILASSPRASPCRSSGPSRAVLTPLVIGRVALRSESRVGDTGRSRRTEPTSETVFRRGAGGRARGRGAATCGVMDSAAVVGLRHRGTCRETATCHGDEDQPEPGRRRVASEGACSRHSRWPTCSSSSKASAIDDDVVAVRADVDPQRRDHPDLDAGPGQPVRRLGGRPTGRRCGGPRRPRRRSPPARCRRAARRTPPRCGPRRWWCAGARRG